MTYPVVVTMFGLAWFDGFRWNRIDSSAGAPVQRIRRRKNSDHISSSALRQKMVISAIGMVCSAASRGCVRHSAALPNASCRKNSSMFVFQDGSCDRSHLRPGSRTGKQVSVWDTKGGSMWANLFNGMYRLEGGNGSSRSPANPRLAW